MEIFDFLSHGDPTTYCTFGTMLLLSVISWAIIFERWYILRKNLYYSRKFLKKFWNTKSLTELHKSRERDVPNPAQDLFLESYGEMSKVLHLLEKDGQSHGGPIPLHTLQRVMQKSLLSLTQKLTKNLTLLAIIATICPFIGLLGTVLGIIRCFKDLGTIQSPNLAQVAPGISEALVSTAVGLATAIPALFAYNFFTASSKKHRQLLEGFATDFLNILERHFNIGK